jgi:hypothetical protein
VNKWKRGSKRHPRALKSKMRPAREYKNKNKRTRVSGLGATSFVSLQLHLAITTYSGWNL